MLCASVLRKNRFAVRDSRFFVVTLIFHHEYPVPDRVLLEDGNQIFNFNFHLPLPFGSLSLKLVALISARLLISYTKSNLFYFFDDARSRLYPRRRRTTERVGTGACGVASCRWSRRLQSRTPSQANLLGLRLRNAVSFDFGGGRLSRASESILPSRRAAPDAKFRERFP